MALTLDPHEMPKVLQIYLELSQYPILARRIRQQMRKEMFGRGVVTREVFEQEVRDKAMRSQEREGISNPLFEEPPDIWQERISQVREHLTDFYFAYNLPHDLFEHIVEEVVSERAPDREFVLAFNPELAPWDLLFAQGEAYEDYPPEKRMSVQHHLQEIRVVLIKAMISDQLSFLRVAREYFTVKDLKEIRAHRIGRGKIGGKAAGMLLAHKVVLRHGEQRGLDVDKFITIPESWYLGSDVFYDFHARNDLFQHMNQKYKRPEQMMVDYPIAYNAYLNSELPDEVSRELGGLLHKVGSSPLIVRSSSLLEDNFDTSFAGKYDSFFLPNQSTPEENLRELQKAIIKIYASVSRPEALIYRSRMGLTDYDERMAILIQKVEGHAHGNYFFPDFAGVGFSNNPYVWSKRIDREAGLLRMVAGLGTRAVDRVGSDYPRMVALSHPTLRPEWGNKQVRHYSQHFIDVIDLQHNEFSTLPVSDVIDEKYPALTAIMSVDKDGFVQPITSRAMKIDPQDLVVTFDTMLAHDDVVKILRESLDILEDAYKRPVDIEFAGDLLATYPRPQARVSILQCRALSRRTSGRLVELPDDIDEDSILFTANQQVPHGCVDNIRYLIYVDPKAYAHIPEPHTRIEIGQVVGRLNHALENEHFILMGPGRWGTSNIELGVKVTYADIYNTKILIEVAFTEEGGGVPEVSYGTHFFQDLVEANIHPLPLYPDDPEVIYREDFFLTAPNLLSRILPGEERFTPFIKVIDLPLICEGCLLAIVMDGELEKAVAYLTDTSPCEPGDS